MKKNLSKEKAIKFVRVFPSTYEKLRQEAHERRISYPELIEELVSQRKNV